MERYIMGIWFEITALALLLYINKSSKGTSYRIGTPSKAIVAAGLMALEGQAYA